MKALLASLDLPLQGYEIQNTKMDINRVYRPTVKGSLPVYEATGTRPSSQCSGGCQLPGGKSEST